MSTTFWCPWRSEGGECGISLGKFTANDDEWWLSILTADSRRGVPKYNSIEYDDRFYVEDIDKKITQVQEYIVDVVTWDTLDAPDEIEYERQRLLEFLHHCENHIGSYYYFES